MNNLISLCILSYKRPEMLINCLDTLHATVDYPCEIIVNVDGSEGEEDESVEIAYSFMRAQKLSKLIIVGGKNRGVGKSLQNCLGVSEGEYLFKIDTDVTFENGWLSTAVNVLKNNPDTAAISLFNYNNYDPNDERFRILEERYDCNIVNDFVSSVYGFRRDSLEEFPFDGVDDGYHQRIAGGGRHLAITKKDYIKNVGFGEKSVYLTFDEKGVPSKTKTHDKPTLF